jgi:exodeoxyribonuclease VII large subunit
LRELRASARRRNGRERDLTATRLLVLRRKRDVAAAERTRAEALIRGDGERLRHAADAATARRARDLERLRLALAAHDPARTLERGYALVEDRDGALITSAEQARAAGALALRFHDGRVRADVEDAAR